MEQFTLCLWARFVKHDGDHVLFTYAGELACVIIFLITLKNVFFRQLEYVLMKCDETMKSAKTFCGSRAAAVDGENWQSTVNRFLIVLWMKSSSSSAARLVNVNFIWFFLLSQFFAISQHWHWRVFHFHLIQVEVSRNPIKCVLWVGDDTQ